MGQTGKNCAISPLAAGPSESGGDHNNCRDDHLVFHSCRFNFGQSRRIAGPSFLVSVRRVLESYESSVIQEWWPDSRRGHRCGRAKTAPVTTAASCDIRAI